MLSQSEESESYRHLKRDAKGYHHQGTLILLHVFWQSKSKSSCLSYWFVKSIPLLTDMFKSKKVASLSEESAYLAEIRQDMFY